jgi:hypothetical protein
MKGRGEGVVIKFKGGQFERWIVTIKQPKDEINAIASITT